MQNVVTNELEGEEMDLQNIQEQLNTEFAKDETRIIFWFDDKGDYSAEVEELCLDNAKLHILTGTNWLYSKWLLNESDPEGKYLVYAPFAKPSDEENPLADMYYYSVPYYTDRVSQMSQEIGIDDKLKVHLEAYPTFWKNKKRIESFKELEIDHYNERNIKIGLIAVVTDVKTPSFEEIVKQVILNPEKDYMKQIDNMGLTDDFWKLCKATFEYESEKSNINDLAVSLIITYAASTLKATLPSSLGSYVLKKRNDAVVFVRNIMDNVLYQSAYDELAENVDKTLRFIKQIRENLAKDSSKEQLDMADILACDTFKGIDEIIIDWMLERLNDEILDAQIDGLNMEQIVQRRLSDSFHYGKHFKNEYQVLKYAYLMMKSIDKLDISMDVVTMVKNYQEKNYLIDSYYRWFYFAFDQLSDNDKFMKLRERIENIYSNDYLMNSLPKWNNLYTGQAVESLGIVRQQEFYRHFLRPYEGGDRVIVIISDALRYECAKELMQRFEYDEKCEAKMDTMLGVLPSVTSLGMASLLPHTEINVDKDMNVTVDGSSCSDLVSRDKILKAKNPDNVAVSFDDIAKANKATVRELLQGKKIVYIYHNQVDARGDKAASENEVFNACAEAIDEIFRLIRKLTGDISATKYIVTADHGFLYRRDKMKEFDKLSFSKDICTYMNKRFLITTERVENQGMASRALTYLNKLNEMYVMTPIGADIFKVAGAGQNYVHGGSSLQEMLVPVVEVKTAKGKQDTDYVDVILTTISRKVTNLITFFDFIQTEKVTDVMKSRNLIAYFATESGEKISFDVPIMANSTADEPEKRAFHEKFTLKSREYKFGDKYYMHIADANDDKNILHSYEFMIDIAFVNDFGF